MRPSLDCLTPEEQSGDSRQKNFNITRAPDPDQQKILRARLEAVTDPELTDGARNLFTFLLDCSLNPRANNDRRGEVTMSTEKLCEWLDRSARAIYGWVKELVKQRHIWVSKFPRPNMYPMNVYHITALQPIREMRQDVANDGMWGNGYRRPDQVIPQGARGGVGKKRQVVLDAYGNPASSKTLENAAPSGKKCGSPPQVLRGAPAQNDTCHPQVLRGTAAEFAGVPRKKQHLPPAKNDTGPQQKTAPFIESQIETETPVLKGEGVPAPQEELGRAIKDQKWERWLATLDDMFPSRLEPLREKLTQQLKALESDRSNADLANAPFKKSREPFLEKLRKEVTELAQYQSEEAKRFMAQRQRELARELSDPKNYEHVLTSAAAQAAELIRRKIAAVTERIEGPSA